jgi:hypothetical protein
VLTNAAPFGRQFPATVTALPAWILVDDGAGTPNILNVISYNGGTQIAVVDQLAAPLNTAVDYWLPSSTIQGSVFPALQLSAANNDWSVELLDHGEMYFLSLSPVRHHAVAAFADATPQDRSDGPLWHPPAAATFVVDGRITKWSALLGDSSICVDLGYWNGSGWRLRWIGPVISAAAVRRLDGARRPGSGRLGGQDEPLDPRDWSAAITARKRSSSKRSPAGTARPSRPSTAPPGIQRPTRSISGQQHRYRGIPSFLLTEDSLTRR